MNRSLRRRILLSTILPLTASRALSAQTSGSWIVDTDSSWSIGSNWSSGPSFPDGGGTASFGEFPSLSGLRAVTLDLASVSLSAITFESETRYGIVPPAGNTSNTIQLTGAANLLATASTPSSPSLILPSHAILAPISGSAGLNKSGAGVVTLVATNTYTGGTTISGGVLATAVGDSAFGAGSITLSGGSIRATTIAMNSARNFVLNAAGTFETTIDITTTGTISGGGTLNKTQSNGILGLAASNSYTGATNIRAGTLVLLASGSIRNSPSILAGGSIVLDNSATNVNDRLGDSATITLQGGGITITGNNGADTTENYGSTNFDGGLSFYTVAPTGAHNLSVTSSGVTRANHATLFARGTNLGATPAANVANIFFTSAPALIGGGGALGSTNISIIPWAWGSVLSNASSNDAANSLLTYGTNGLRPLNATTEYASNLTSGATTNVRLTASTALNNAQTVNALVLGSGGALTGSGTLTIASGALMNFNSITIIAPAINFGSAEGIIAATSLLTINGKISGTGGLTKTALGGATLNSTASDYTGQTTIVAGNITIGSNVTAGVAGPLGASSSAIVIAPGSAFGGGARLWINGSSTVTISRDLIATGNPAGIPALGTAVIGPTLVMNGNIDIETLLELQGDPGRTIFLNGTISGPGRLTDSFSSGNVISGNNSYSGGTEIRDGSYALGNNSALGTGTIWFTGLGSISADGAARNISNPIVVLANPNIAGSQDLTLSGPIDLAGTTFTHTISNTALTTYAGPVSAGGFVKAGAGTLALTGTNTFTGFVTVNSGALRIASLAALGTPQNRTTVASGAALELQPGAVTSEPVTISGNGISATGAIRNLSGTNSLGPVTLSADSFVAVDSGTLSTGPIGGLFALTKLGAGTMIARNYRVGTFSALSGTARVIPGRSTAATSVVSKVTISAGTSLDLGDNDLVIDYLSSDPLTSIQLLLTNGYNSGAWNGTSAINSSGAAMTAASAHKTALGFAEASELFSSFPATFSGQSVDSTAVLVRYTSSGDANIDGTVDTIDFNLLAANFSLTGKRWFNGDFDYNQTVDTVDFNLLVSNFGIVVAAPVALVPEPFSAPIALLIALIAPRRRRGHVHG